MWELSLPDTKLYFNIGTTIISTMWNVVEVAHMLHERSQCSRMLTAFYSYPSCYVLGASCCSWWPALLLSSFQVSSVRQGGVEVGGPHHVTAGILWAEYRPYSSSSGAGRRGVCYGHCPPYPMTGAVCGVLYWPLTCWRWYSASIWLSSMIVSGHFAFFCFAFVLLLCNTVVVVLMQYY